MEQAKLCHGQLSVRLTLVTLVNLVVSRFNTHCSSVGEDVGSDVGDVVVTEGVDGVVSAGVEGVVSDGVEGVESLSLSPSPPPPPQPQIDARQMSTTWICP
jgi:hypothetical protein